MKTADCDILIVPGLGGSEEDHWQARWAGRLATARVVEQDQWHAPTPEAWCGRIAEAVAAATRPVGGFASAAAGGLAARDASGHRRYPRAPRPASASRASHRRPPRAGGTVPSAAELSRSAILP